MKNKKSRVIPQLAACLLAIAVLLSACVRSEPYVKSKYINESGAVSITIQNPTKHDYFVRLDYTVHVAYGGGISTGAQDVPIHTESILVRANSEYWYKTESFTPPKPSSGKKSLRNVKITSTKATDE